MQETLKLMVGISGGKMIVNSLFIARSVNVPALFGNYHIVLYCTVFHFEHSPLNSYCIYIGYCIIYYFTCV